MGRKRKPPLLSLEEQLRAHDANAPDGPTYVAIWDDGKDAHLSDVSAERMQWAKKRLALVDAIHRRDAKKLRDPGRDASGNFSASPYAQRGHKTEVAPKELRANPDSEQFPKRVTTQRVVDRLRARGTIGLSEWSAASFLWETWCGKVTGDRLVAAYDAVVVHSTPDTGRLVAKRMDAATLYVHLLALIPRRCQGVVVHVVINDWELSDWGINTGKSDRSKRRDAANRLSRGLSALAAHLGY